MELARVENLSFGPARTPLVKGLSFSLEAGEVVHLKGANGAGKSFLLRTILGLATPLAGKVSLREGAQRYLPQMQNRAAHLPFSLGELLDFHPGRDFGLIRPELKSRSWNRASGGERQRVLLSRFFSQKGDLWVLDEPFNHLDTPAKEMVRALIRTEMKQNSQVGLLLVSHDDQPAHWLEGIKLRTLDLEDFSERYS